MFGFYKQGKQYDYVFTVCDESQAGKCPVFPGTAATKRIYWGFDDPSSFQGALDVRMEKTREIRDKIKREIVKWLNEKTVRVG